MVAQVVEHSSEKAGVVSASLTHGTSSLKPVKAGLPAEARFSEHRRASYNGHYATLPRLRRGFDSLRPLIGFSPYDY